MKTIEGYPGYQINEQGEVYSLWKNGGTDGKEISSVIQMRLKPWKKNQYLCVTLFRKVGVVTEHKHFRLHVLVAKTFLGFNSINVKGKRKVVGFLNGNTRDCRAANLIISDDKENKARLKKLKKG